MPFWDKNLGKTAVEMFVMEDTGFRGTAWLAASLLHFAKGVGKLFCSVCGCSECFVETFGLNSSYVVACGCWEFCLVTWVVSSCPASAADQVHNFYLLLVWILKLGLNISPLLCLFAYRYSDHSKYVSLNELCYSQSWWTCIYFWLVGIILVGNTQMCFSFSIRFNELRVGPDALCMHLGIVSVGQNKVRWKIPTFSWLWRARN